MKPQDKVRLSTQGLTMNPTLANRIGTVESIAPGCVEVRFGEGREAEWVWLKDAYVEPANER